MQRPLRAKQGNSNPIWRVFLRLVDPHTVVQNLQNFGLFVGCDQKTAITTHLKCILPYLPKAKYFSVIFSHEEYYPEVQNTYFLNNMKLSQPLQLAQWSVNVKKTFISVILVLMMCIVRYIMAS
ncbi:V-type proton ATPase catalytic subunit [Trichinella spiralis]|uniref:V-type proton ATPase catalytic subunit n=1 Tax=Trichinella spiralis TaxID=6334 RepID=A0ABR3KJB8_TRISP